MVEPNEHPSNQRQRIVSEPPRFGRAPIRKNPPPKIIGIWKTANRILICSKPAGPEPYIVVDKQKDIPSKLLHCPVPSMREAPPSFGDDVRLGPGWLAAYQDAI